METSQAAVGIAVAAVVGGAIGFVIARLSARANSAGNDAHLAAAKQRVVELEREVKAERANVSAAKDDAAKAGASADRNKALYEEKLASVDELRKLVDQSKIALTDAFKATGADVLKATTAVFMANAKAQFEGHAKLSQQDLEARQKAIDATLAPIKEQMLKQETLMQAIDARRAIDATTLTEQFKQIAGLQQKASDAAQLLTSAMRDNRQRGKWGENQLTNIVEMAGMTAHISYKTQATVEGVAGQVRPDMIVRLPGGRVVPIDSKVPMDAYLDSLRPELSDAERATRLAAHPNAVRMHAKALKRKEYAKAAGADIDITVMFVPVESALSLALEMDGSIFEDALEDGVVITTPATLLALLRICALQWQQEAISQNAQKIGESAKLLLERITIFAEHLQKIKKGLDAATSGYKEAINSFNSRLLTSARTTAELVGDVDLVPERLNPAEPPVNTEIKGLKTLGTGDAVRSSSID